MGLCSSKKPVGATAYRVPDQGTVTLTSSDGGKRVIPSSIMYNKKTLEARKHKKMELEKINKQHAEDMKHSDEPKGDAAPPAPITEPKPAPTTATTAVVAAAHAQAAPSVVSSAKGEADGAAMIPSVSATAGEQSELPVPAVSGGN